MIILQCILQVTLNKHGAKLNNFNTMLKPIGHYMYRTVVTICTARHNIHNFYVLPTQCIYVFCVDLRTNSDYFPVQH